MQFKRLFEPGKIGRLEIRNRIVLPPMVTRFASKDGEVTDRMVDYYLARASGVGLLVTEAAYSEPGGHPGRISIYDDKFVPGLRWLADSVRKAGCKVAVELNPNRGRADEAQPMCASEIPPCRYIPVPNPARKPKVLTVKDIDEVVRDFGIAARRVKDIGFDALMVHGAGPYLVTDFLSPLTNKRSDEYGGDVKGRARLAIRLFEAARKEFGGPIIFRMSVDQRTKGGFSINDAIIVCRMLESAGCDAIDVISGSYASHDWTMPPMALPPGCNADLATAIKANVRIPVMVAGRINDPVLAEQMLEQGTCDFVDMGRALIADPDLPKKAQAGRAEDIRHCLACNKCWESSVAKGVLMKCTVNGEVGREKECLITPAKKKKKVLVIGSGPGGLEAARSCALRGHKVTLWEKSNRLGGQLHLAAVPPLKQEIMGLLRYFTAQIQKAGVAVELNREAMVESVVKFDPDVVVVASGSLPRVPNIAGIHSLEGRLMFARDVLNGAETGASVVVIGGGLVGCETAEYLAEKGKRVVVLEIVNTIAADVPYNQRDAFLQRLEEKGVSMLAKVTYDQVTAEGMSIITGQGEKRLLKPDNIVLAAGSAPDDQLYRLLQGKVPECYAVGDCARPGMIMEATWQAVDVALKL